MLLYDAQNPRRVGRGSSLAVYFDVFGAVTQAFLKIGFLHAFAPTGKEPPFVIAQLATLALFVVIGVIAFKRYRGHAVHGVISGAASGA